MSRKLAEMLDGAKYVRYNEGYGKVVAWYGGNALHVWSQDGDALEVRNFNINNWQEAHDCMSNLYGGGWYARQL